MKNLLFLLLFLSSNSLFAQEITAEDPPEKRAAYITAQMVEKLELDSAQEATFQKINLKYARLIQKEIIDKDLNIFSQYNKGMKINKEKEKELLPVLSEKQKEQYNELKKEHSKKILAKLFGF